MLNEINTRWGYEMLEQQLYLALGTTGALKAAGAEAQPSRNPHVCEKGQKMNQERSNLCHVCFAASPRPAVCSNRSVSSKRAISFWPC